MSKDRTKLRIGLVRIDGCEIAHGKIPGQPFGEEARDCLHQTIGGNAVRVESQLLVEAAGMPIMEAEFGRLHPGVPHGTPHSASLTPLAARFQER